MKYDKETLVKKSNRKWVYWCAMFGEVLLLILSFVFAIIEKGTVLYTIACIVLGLVLSFEVFMTFDGKRTIERSEHRDILSTKTFVALRNANIRKTLEVMRYTYGKVSNWNPINYYKNMATYDIHEQLRGILISLRDLVIDLDDTGALNSDNVSVELIYSYGCSPIEAYEKKDKNANMNSTDSSDTTNDESEDETRRISSGEYDLEKPSEYLGIDESFFKFVYNSKGGYYFANDKNMIQPCIKNDKKDDKKDEKSEHHYIVSKKDLRYDEDEETANSRGMLKPFNRIEKENKCAADAGKQGDYVKYRLHNPGSIVCLFFNLNNDLPSEICIGAVLSISTYGHKLCNDPKELPYFKEAFRKNVLHSYKSLIISELAQMYIRHSVCIGERNPITGDANHRIGKIAAEDMMNCVDNVVRGYYKK